MFCYWVDAKATQGFTRMQNAHVAEIVGRHPRRFVGMATVPLQAPALAIDELRHAREGLALSAVEIGTCPGGRDFDDPALFDFFAACVDLDVAVFVHPAAPLIGLDRMRRYYFPLIVGNPHETALASSTLIFGGVLELDRVVLGSDYPFDMGADDPVRAVESAELAPAARFLGLPAP